MINERNPINTLNNKEYFVVRMQLLSLALLAIVGTSACRFRPDVDYIPTKVPLAFTARPIPLTPLPTSTLEQEIHKSTPKPSEVAAEVILPTITPTPEVKQGDGVCDLVLDPEITVRANGEVGVLTGFKPEQDPNNVEDSDCFADNSHYQNDTFSEYLVKFVTSRGRIVGAVSEEYDKHVHQYVTNGLNGEKVVIEINAAVYPENPNNAGIVYDVEPSTIIVE